MSYFRRGSLTQRISTSTLKMIRDRTISIEAPKLFTQIDLIPLLFANVELSITPN